MRYIEAPTELPAPWLNRHKQDPEKTTDVLFLAGGITGCPDWQADAVKAFDDLSDLTILNPRRENFPIDDPSAAKAQIKWEFQHLRKANIISFWFPAETLCPITLYELGAWTDKAPVLFVGTHKDYARRQDVVIQTKLRKPDQIIFDRLGSMLYAMRQVLTLDY